MAILFLIKFFLLVPSWAHEILISLLMVVIFRVKSSTTRAVIKNKFEIPSFHQVSELPQLFISYCGFFDPLQETTMPYAVKVMLPKCRSIGGSHNKAARKTLLQFISLLEIHFRRGIRLYCCELCPVINLTLWSFSLSFSLAIWGKLIFGIFCSHTRNTEFYQDWN